MISLVALGLSLSLIFVQLDTIQTARYRAALDYCRTTQKLVRSAIPERRYQRYARRIIMQTGLTDCRGYARRVESGRLTH